MRRGMRSAAIRALLFFGLVLGGLWSGGAAAGQQVDPIGQVTSVISTIASQTTVASDLTGSVTSSGSGSGSGAVGAVSGAVGGAVSGATDGAAGAVSAESLTGSGSSSGGGSGSSGGGSGSTSGATSSRSAARSNPRSPHTRFDRLPRRYETLLERIESGRHVRASIARLRALLASASPQLRARVMRLIRLEIRRLQRGGLNRRERAAVQRLRRLMAALRTPAPAPAPSTGSRMVAAAVEGSGVLAEATSGIETTSGRDIPASAPGTGSHSSGSPDSGPAGVGGPIPGLPLPPVPPSGPPYWPLLVLAAIACLLLLLSRAGRQILPAPVRGLIEVRQPDVWALAAAVGFGLLAGLLVVLLLHAAPL
jgi:hypothetical protein